MQNNLFSEHGIITFLEIDKNENKLEGQIRISS